MSRHKWTRRMTAALLALVLIEGLSYREAAQVMEVPIGTLTSRLARGRLALQAMLTDQSITRVARKD